MQSEGKLGEEKTAGTTHLEKAMPRLSTLLNSPFVEVEATGLRFSAQAGHSERLKTFGLLDKSQSEGTWWHNFAIADCFLSATQQEQQEMEKICLRQSHNNLQILRNRVSVGRSWAPGQRKVGICYNFFRECSFRAFGFEGRNILLERFVNKSHPHGKIVVNDLKLLKKYPHLISAFLAGDFSVAELRQQESLTKDVPASAETQALPAAQADDADPLLSMPVEVSNWIHAFIRSHGRDCLISLLDAMPRSASSQFTGSHQTHDKNWPVHNNHVVIPEGQGRRNNRKESTSGYPSSYAGSTQPPTAEHRSQQGEFSSQRQVPDANELLNSLFPPSDFSSVVARDRRHEQVSLSADSVPPLVDMPASNTGTYQAEECEASESDLDEAFPGEENDNCDEDSCGGDFYDDGYDDYGEAALSGSDSSLDSLINQLPNDLVEELRRDIVAQQLPGPQLCTMTTSDDMDLYSRAEPAYETQEEAAGDAFALLAPFAKLLAANEAGLLPQITVALKPGFTISAPHTGAIEAACAALHRMVALPTPLTYAIQERLAVLIALRDTLLPLIAEPAPVLLD